MQVNRLSLGLQEALKSATNFNTARSETLFDEEKYGVSKEDGEELDFSTLNVDDLTITEDQIAGLFAMFQDEVIAIFGSNLPFMQAQKNNPNSPDNPEKNEPSNDANVDGAQPEVQSGSQPTRVFTA